MSNSNISCENLATSRSKIVRYQASTPNAKYLGANLRAFTDNLRLEVRQPILQKFPLEKMVASAWLDAQFYLDMLREIETYCTFEELVAVGIKSVERFPLRPDINSIEIFLDAAADVFQLALRDCSPAEKIRVEKLGSTHYRMIHHLPLPPFLMYGATYGMLKRVKRPDQTPIIVMTNDDTPYVFEVTW
jgi:hypothetical protein